MDTIQVGKSGSVEYVPPVLVNTIERCLCRLVNDPETTPEEMTRGMWYAAAMLDALANAAPSYVIKEV